MKYLILFVQERRNDLRFLTGRNRVCDKILTDGGRQKAMARPMVPQEAGSVFKKTKATWKLTKAARNRILELVVDGFSYSEAAEFVKREMKITVCKETVKYQVSKNLDFVLQQRNQAYEWALLEFQQIMAGHDESPDAWNMDLKAVVEEVIREDKIVRELAKLVGWTD